MTESRLLIGSRVEVIPISQISETAWSAQAVRCRSLGHPDSSIARPHRIVPGKALIGWLLNKDTDRHHAEVSDSNFGFLPISDRMRPRYVTCLGRVETLLRQTEEMQLCRSRLHFRSEGDVLSLRTSGSMGLARGLGLVLGEPSRERHGALRKSWARRPPHYGAGR